MSYHATKHALQDLLLSPHKDNVELGLTILSSRLDKAAYTRLLLLIAHSQAAQPIGQICRIFLHKELLLTYQTVHHELDFLTDTWRATVAEKEAYLKELQHFEQFYRPYLECNRDYGQPIYETIAKQLVFFQQNKHAVTYYNDLLRWFPQKAHYWYQYAKLDEKDCLDALLCATNCKDVQPIHCYELALFYWCNLNKKKQALKWVQRALQLHDAYAPALCLLGDLYAADKKWLEAASCYQKSVQLDTYNTIYQNRYAISLLAQRCLPEEALAHAATAYSNEPHHPLYRVTQAVALWLCAQKKIEALEILTPVAQTLLGALVQIALEQDKPQLLKSYFEHYLNEVDYEELP